MSDPLDPASPVPLYHQIAEAIRYRVATGALKAGDGLPSLKNAARSWGVNLHTVREAYKELAAEGIVETRTPLGTRILASIHSTSRERAMFNAFLDRIRREALDLYGISSIALGRLLLRGSLRAAPRSAAVWVVECSETQSEDLASQLVSHWDVDARPWNLERNGEPPRGSIVATYFHYNNVRRLWPERLADTHFAAIHPDPTLLGDLLAQAPRARKLQVILFEREPTMASNIAADLDLILPKDRIALKTRILRRPDRLILQRKRSDLLLFSPRVWGILPESVRDDPRVREVRYVFDGRDVARIAQDLDWIERSRQIGRSRWPGEASAFRPMKAAARSGR